MLQSCNHAESYLDGCSSDSAVAQLRIHTALAVAVLAAPMLLCCRGLTLPRNASPQFSLAATVECGLLQLGFIAGINAKLFLK
jgi:hypothetical protein